MEFEEINYISRDEIPVLSREFPKVFSNKFDANKCKLKYKLNPHSVPIFYKPMLVTVCSKKQGRC